MNIENIVNRKTFNDVTIVYDDSNSYLAYVPVWNKNKTNSYVFPINLVENTKYIEDRNFDQHFGLSIRGLLRALYVNFKNRRIKQGGSTIAQQLIRTLIPVKNRYLRKIVEIILAPLVTVIQGRNWVINSYLKNVFVGNGLSGFPIASKIYLRKEVDKLSDLESLALASYLTKPNFWLRHPEKISQKIRLIIYNRNQMTYSRKQIARLTRKISKNSSRNELPDWFPKFNSYVRKVSRAENELSLSINTRLQKHLHRRFRIKAKDSALMIIEHKTFSVKCILDYIGGERNQYPTFFSKRVNVGSLLKPLLCLLAVRKGYDPSNLFFESKYLEIEFPGFPLWVVKNYKERYNGKISLALGVAKSDNSVCVQAMQFLGFENFKNLLVEFNLLNNPTNITPSIILGSTSEGMCLISLAKIYCQFASFKNLKQKDFLLKNRDVISSIPINQEFIAVRKAMKLAISDGTCSSLIGTNIVGAKTGSDGKYQNIILFDSQNTYMIIHKEKEESILREQYLDSVFKSYGLVNFAKDVVKEIQRFANATIGKNDLYSKETNAA